MVTAIQANLNNNQIVECSARDLRTVLVGYEHSVFRAGLIGVKFEGIPAMAIIQGRHYVNSFRSLVLFPVVDNDLPGNTGLETPCAVRVGESRCT